VIGLGKAEPWERFSAEIAENAKQRTKTLGFFKLGALGVLGGES